MPIFVTALAIASTEAGITGKSHAIRVLVEQIGYGALLGIAAGGLAAGVVILAAPRGLVDRSWLQVVPAAAAILAFTSATAVGGSGFIAAFVAGVVFGGLRRRVGGEVGYLLEQLGALLGAATFVVFGAVLLGPALGVTTWAVAGYAVLSLTLVRLLPVAIAFVGTRARPPTVGFVGWFGPRGLASIVFAIVIIDNAGELPHESVILTTIFVTIGLSVLAHGVTAAPLPAATAPGLPPTRGPSTCRSSRARCPRCAGACRGQRPAELAAQPAPRAARHAPGGQPPARSPLPFRRAAGRPPRAGRGAPASSEGKLPARPRRRPRSACRLVPPRPAATVAGHRNHATGGRQMTLKHPQGRSGPATDLSIAPVFTLESQTLPRHELPAGELAPDVAYQIVHDELMLDGNARLNLATFVTTWMEPQAERLMAECFDKNMIDKDEYPQTADARARAASTSSATSGTRRTRSRRPAARRPARARRRCSAGSRSSGAGSHRREAAGEPADRPNIVMGINVQVCWEKFANYWDVEMRLVPMEGDRFHLSRRGGGRALRREHDRRRRDPRLDLRRLLRAGRRDLRRPRRARRRGPASTSRCTSTAPRAASSPRSSTPSSSGTSGCRASPRSTPRATSTGSSTPASAGSSGATRRRCRTT